jgi:hypothetical protein
MRKSSSGALAEKDAAVDQCLPWYTDASAGRRAALRDGKPCVILLNADSGAL